MFVAGTCISYKGPRSKFLPCFSLSLYGLKMEAGSASETFCVCVCMYALGRVAHCLRC